MNLADRINAIPVSGEDLVRTAATIHRLPPEGRDWKARAGCALRLFAQDPIEDKAYAVTARLEAMAQLVARDALPEAFAPRAADGTRLLAESVFAAAAAEPMLCREAACFFDPEGFVARIALHADVDVDERA